MTVSSARTLRVVTFQALGPDSAVDAALRSQLVPRLLGERSVRNAWQGRRGGADGNHVLVSTWADGPVDGPFEPPDIAFLREALAGLGGVELAAVEQLEIAVHAQFQRPEPPRVLRVFHGSTRLGELTDYVDDARAGMTEDARVNDGLVSFVLAHDRQDAFVSVSTWTGWPAIEAATGGNTRQPFATRQTRRLAGYRIVHLELLPEAPVSARSGGESRLKAAT